jgi:predicted membrane protein
MQQRTQSLGRLIIGLGIILFGTLILLDNLDVIEARHLFHYWPVLLIAYGAYRMLTPGAGKGFGLVVLVIGAVLLANAMDLTDINLWELWPVLIILLGLSLIFRARNVSIAGGSSQGGGAATSEDFVSGTAILGGFNRVVTSADFRGASLTAIMGGCELDLTGASIKASEAVIDVFAFWGGVKLRVPPGWQVQAEATAILGGIDDKARSTGEGERKRLIIRGQAVMGGVEITN